MAKISAFDALANMEQNGLIQINASELKNIAFESTALGLKRDKSNDVWLYKFSISPEDYILELRRLARAMLMLYYRGSQEPYTTFQKFKIELFFRYQYRYDRINISTRLLDTTTMDTIYKGDEITLSINTRYSVAFDRDKIILNKIGQTGSDYFKSTHNDVDEGTQTSKTPNDFEKDLQVAINAVENLKKYSGLQLKFHIKHDYRYLKEILIESNYNG